MASAGTTDQDPLWGKRWMLLTSMIGILAAVALLVAIHHAQWSWLLFAWGFAVGLVALAIIALIGVAAHRQATTDDQRVRLRRRLVIYTCCWITACLMTGSISAAFNQVWIDIVVTGYVVLTLGVASLVVLRRRSSFK